VADTDDYKPSRPTLPTTSRSPAFAVVFQRTAAFRPFAIHVAGRATLGRDDLAAGLKELHNVNFVDTTVSTSHVDLKRTNGGKLDVTVRGRNGVSLNGWPVGAGERAQLEDGEILRLGNTVLVFRRHQADRVGDPKPVARSRDASLVAPFGLNGVRHELEALAGQRVRCALVLGESGTGKELLARRVAEALGRNAEKFFPVNVAALAKELFDTELMGSKAGAFTGALDRAGVVESADGGTVFLDEIGDVAPGQQVNLLRMIENQEVRRVGSKETKRVDVLFVLATNRDLSADAGPVRPDLLARVEATIRLPPLRLRPEDVVEVARELRSRQKLTLDLADSEAEAIELLLLARWRPGNVRDLNRVLLAHDRIAREKKGLRLAPLSAALGETPGRLRRGGPVSLDDVRRSAMCPAAVAAARDAVGGDDAADDAIYAWLAAEGRAVRAKFFSGGTIERWLSKVPPTQP
jgi:MoxR-like ATPase